MTDFEKPTVVALCRKVFENEIAENQVFSGLEFKRMCVKHEPKFRYKYEDTFMRVLRKYYRKEFICINRPKSQYQKVAKI